MTADGAQRPAASSSHLSRYRRNNFSGHPADRMLMAQSRSSKGDARVSDPRPRTAFRLQTTAEFPQSARGWRYAARENPKARQEPGRDVGVFGIGGTDEAMAFHPALTTVLDNPAKIGSIAAETLLNRLSDPQAPPRHILLEPKLVIRASCGESIG